MNTENAASSKLSNSNDSKETSNGIVGTQVGDDPSPEAGNAHDKNRDPGVDIQLLPLDPSKEANDRGSAEPEPVVDPVETSTEAPEERERANSTTVDDTASIPTSPDHPDEGVGTELSPSASKGDKGEKGGRSNGSMEPELNKAQFAPGGETAASSTDDEPPAGKRKDEQEELMSRLEGLHPELATFVKACGKACGCPPEVTLLIVLFAASCVMGPNLTVRCGGVILARSVCMVLMPGSGASIDWLYENILLPLADLLEQLRGKVASHHETLLRQSDSDERDDITKQDRIRELVESGDAPPETGRLDEALPKIDLRSLAKSQGDVYHVFARSVSLPINKSFAEGLFEAVSGTLRQQGRLITANLALCINRRDYIHAVSTRKDSLIGMVPAIEVDGLPLVKSTPLPKEQTNFLRRLLKQLVIGGNTIFASELDESASTLTRKFVKQLITSRTIELDESAKETLDKFATQFEGHHLPFDCLNQDSGTQYTIRLAAVLAQVLNVLDEETPSQTEVVITQEILAVVQLMVSRMIHGMELLHETAKTPEIQRAAEAVLAARAKIGDGFTLSNLKTHHRATLLQQDPEEVLNLLVEWGKLTTRRKTGEVGRPTTKYFWVEPPA